MLNIVFRSVRKFVIKTADIDWLLIHRGRMSCNGEGQQVTSLTDDVTTGKFCSPLRWLVVVANTASFFSQRYMSFQRLQAASTGQPLTVQQAVVRYDSILAE